VRKEEMGELLPTLVSLPVSFVGKIPACGLEIILVFGDCPTSLPTETKVALALALS
jgi:hypothetical protein